MRWNLQELKIEVNYRKIINNNKYKEINKKDI